MNVFINEIHYDNDGTDTGEAIELVGEAGIDLTGWSLVLYNGNDGASYNTRNLSGFIADLGNGFGTVVINYPTNGVQNGAPDGIALVDNNGTVVQFLSYEGTFTATNGPAVGLTSTDIGVAESSTTPVGFSLQLTGTGASASDFTWAAAATNTFGAANTGQTLVATTPETVDLSTYVRIGRYNLPIPARTPLSPAGNELALEVSAVTYNPDTDTLFVLGDEGTSIVQVSKTGQLIDSMTLATGDFDDPEGLTFVNGNQFVLVEERERQANLFTYVPGGTLSRADVQSVKLGTTVGNIGLEGISYDPQTGGYVLVKETSPQGIFQTGIDFAAGTATNGSPTTTNSSNLFDPALLGLTDIADVYALSNLPGSLTDDNLLVLSQEDGRIVSVDRSGNITSSLQIVADPGNPLTVTGQGFEGVTMDGNGLLYITSEQGGGDSEHPQLWVYAPASFVYANAAPVEVSLSNAVNNLAENSDTTNPIKIGNIIISDDALGTNTLSLTGADAAAFEIVGTELFLKAGTALDFETKPSLAVTINVDDATLGSAPDASTTFTLDIADTTDTPANLIISEVAPWSSGNSPGVGADWFEVTNTSGTAIDITGWRMDDSSASFASSVALSGVTSLAPNQSAIFIEGDATKVTAFVNTWFGGTLPTGVQIGTYSGSGVGLGTGGDAVNLFDAGGALVTGVTFGASPSASPFASFDNTAGLPSVSNLSVVGVNGAFSVIDVGTNAAAVLIGSPGTTSVAPVPLTTQVAIAATDAAAAEDGQNPGTFTILRTGDTTDALTVVYGFAVGAGQATSDDYTPTLTGNVEIPAGASSVNITITPVDDLVPEGTETLTLVLSDESGYDLGTKTSATVTIADNDSAIANFNLQVSEIWSGNSVGDNLTADWFEITNIGTEAWVSGVAPDLYYDDDSQSPSEADLISGITQIDPGESVVVVVTKNATADVTTFASVWGSVIDLTGVDIGSTPGAGLGADGDGVSLFVGLPGTGAVPADFETYPTGSAGRSYNVGLAAFSETGQNGAVATAPNGNGQPAIGSPGDGTPIISGPTIAIAAQDANAAEAGQDPGTFRISRTGATTSALSVSYTVATGTGQATSDDYTPTLTETVEIPVGASFVDITITPVDDAAIEGAETVTLTLTDTANYDLGTDTSATVTIADNDTVAPPAQLVPGDVIFNEYVSDNDANGNDFFELLVFKDGADLRGLRVSDNELVGGVLNINESVFVFGNDSFLSNVPKGTTIAVYTTTAGITTDTVINPTAGDWTMVLAPGTGVTTSADGLGGSLNTGLATGGEALYLYLPGADGTSAGTDNQYLDFISYESDGGDAPTGLVDLNLPSLADNAYYTGNTAAGNDDAANWVRYDFPSTNPTPGDVNPGQDLSSLRQPKIVINELLASHTGTDNTEFIELFGTPGASLAGLSLIIVESDESGLGTIDRRIDFTASDVLGENGFFLIGNPAGLATNYGVTPNQTIGNDFLENSSLTAALVKTSSISGTSVMGSEEVVDTVGITDGGAGDSFFFNAPVIGPDGTFFPAGVRRVTNGVDTDTAADWVISAFNLGAANTPTPGLSAGVTLTQSGGNTAVTEGGATDTYTIVLNSQPTANVTITITPDAQVTTNTTSLVFTSANWNVAQTVTVTAVDDVAIEGNHTGSITHSAASTDAAYNDVTIPAVTATITDNDAAVVITKIHQIQGNASTQLPNISGSGAHDDRSPLEGQTVTIQGIVTAVYPQLNGFFIQEENADVDGDSTTSEGIFVFTGSAPTVSEGNLVTVTGAVDEFFGMTQIDNDNSNLSVTINNNGNNLNLISPAIIDLPATGDRNDYYEQFEGMKVQFNDKLVVSEYFELARYGQLVLTEGARPFQYSHTDNTPTAAEYTAFLDSLERSRIILDDGNNIQNAPLPNGVFPYPQPGGLSTGTQGTNYFRGGDSITDLTGVLHWSFAGQAGTDAWRIRPTAADPISFTVENPRPTTAPEVGGNVKVASFNVLNYFNTIDTVGGSNSPRGADSIDEFNRQNEKLMAALQGINADVFGLVEIENNGTAVQELVNRLNAVVGAGTYDYINTGVVGTDAITVALIYKVGVVAPKGAAAILDDPAFTDPNGTGVQRSRPAIAQTFEVINPSNPDFGEAFNVVVNHLKSKGAAGATGADLDQLDGQGAWNDTRTKAAAYLANTWIPSDPTGQGDADWLIIGDLNAYKGETPITALQNAGYTDLVEQFGGPNAYSYVFDGQLGYLDYALANSALASQVTGVAEWHINADEVPVFDYNNNIDDGAGEQSFEAKPTGNPLYEGNAFRTSDHDPVIIGLDLKPNFNVIDGTTGRDTLVGTAGKDIITGFANRDTLTGGGNADIFRYISTVDAGDRITDFEVGLDVIDVSTLLQSIGYAGSNPLAEGVIGVSSVRGSTLVTVDVDGATGSGRAIGYITVDGVSVTALNSADNFVFFA